MKSIKNIILNRHFIVIILLIIGLIWLYYLEKSERNDSNNLNKLSNSGPNVSRMLNLNF
jgi:hypothetical protein